MSGDAGDRARQAMARHEELMRLAERMPNERERLVREAEQVLRDLSEQDPGWQRLAAEVRAIIGETTGVRG